MPNSARILASIFPSGHHNCFDPHCLTKPTTDDDYALRLHSSGFGLHTIMTKTRKIFDISKIYFMRTSTHLPVGKRRLRF